MPRWSENEHRRLIEMVALGHTNREVASVFPERTETAVIQKISQCRGKLRLADRPKRGRNTRK